MFPVSRTPRRLINVMRARIPRQITSVYGCQLGMAETSAPTPAETRKPVAECRVQGNEEFFDNENAEPALPVGDQEKKS